MVRKVVNCSIFLIACAFYGGAKVLNLMIISVKKEGLQDESRMSSSMICKESEIPFCMLRFVLTGDTA